MIGMIRCIVQFPARAVLTLLGLLVATVCGRAAQHEVTIYSYFTEAGKAAAAWPSDHVVRCRLFSAGYEEMGEVRASPPSPPPSAERVTALLAAALRFNRFLF